MCVLDEVMRLLDTAAKARSWGKIEITVKDGKFTEIINTTVRRFPDESANHVTVRTLFNNK